MLQAHTHTHKITCVDAYGQKILVHRHYYYVLILDDVWKSYAHAAGDDDYGSKRHALCRPQLRQVPLFHRLWFARCSRQ